MIAFFSGTAQSVKPALVIFDSDMGPDYDDVGAIAILHSFADSGYIRILATVASTNYEGVAGVFDVFNSYFNRPEIPVGVVGKNGLNLRDWQHWTDTLLAKYPHRIKYNSEAFPATGLYRKILASQPDQSVTIISTGFFTNLSDLLKSAADEYSKLGGKELVKKKVKELVSMAGRFPSGKEFNVEKDAAASAYVFSHWPTPVILSGFQIGEKIRTGLPLVDDSAIRQSPVKDVFALCIPMAASDSLGRMSWDETAVLVAVKGISPWYETETGRMDVKEDGSDEWRAGSGNQYSLVEKSDYRIVQALLNQLMQHQPVKH